MKNDFLRNCARSTKIITWAVLRWPAKRGSHWRGDQPLSCASKLKTRWDRRPGTNLAAPGHGNSIHPEKAICQYELREEDVQIEGVIDYEDGPFIVWVGLGFASCFWSALSVLLVVSGYCCVFELSLIWNSDPSLFLSLSSRSRVSKQSTVR